MKVAILSESEADEAAYRILVDAVLGTATEPVRPANLRSRGWPSVIQVLPSVVKYLHFRTGAEGLVVVADSNHSPVHASDHEVAAAAQAGCRLCQLQQAAGKALASCRALPERPKLRLAFGLAIPAVEAWLLCGVDSSVSEAAWINGMRERRDPYTKLGLKQRVGTDRASLGQARERMTNHARQLAREVALLERAFPIGFGSLAKSLRSWRAPTE